MLVFLRRHHAALAILLSLVSSLLVYSYFSDWAYDDPFITYRYAANLARGQGFVYNAGEQVLSTTTPLFTVLLAGIAWLTGGQELLPTLANLAGALSLGAGGWLLWKLGHVWQTPLAGWSALLLYPTFPLLANTLGSETPLYLAFCLGSLASYAYERYNSAALLAALATLTRPDGILIGFILAGHFFLVRRKMIPRQAMLWFSLPLLAWGLFAWSYFGSPVPVTLAAKQSQAGMLNAETFAPGLLNILSWFKPWQYAVELTLAIGGIAVVLLRKRNWLLLIGWTVLYFAGYSLLQVSPYFWYYAPLVPAFVALVAVGIWAVGELGVAGRAEKRDFAIAFGFVAAGLISFLFITQFNSLLGLANQPDTRTKLYRQAGTWIRDNTAEDVTVGCLETGIIGFYAQRRMVDFAGLLYPEVAGRLRDGGTYEQAAFYSVEKYHQDVMVLQEGLFQKLEQDIISSNCRPMMRFQEDTYPYPLVIYNCQ